MAEMRECGPDCEDCKPYREWLALLQPVKAIDWAKLLDVMGKHRRIITADLNERGHREGWLPAGLHFEYGNVAVGERGQPATALPFDEPPVFTCPECGRRSWNPNDRIHGYCGNCHAYTGSATSE